MSDSQNLKNDNVSQASAEDQLRHLAQEGKRIASESLKDAEKIYGDTLKQATALVRKHPVESLLIGFGVGCLLGLALAQR